MEKLFSFMVLCAGLMGELYASSAPHDDQKVVQTALRKALEPSENDRLATLCAQLKLPPHEIFTISDEDMRIKYRSSKQAPMVDEILKLRKTPEAQELFAHMAYTCVQDRSSSFKPFVDSQASEKALLRLKLQTARENAKRRGRR